MTDQFHITATQMRALVALLGEIPALIDDLAITLTRQDCIGAGGMRVTGGSDEQPLPINLAASDAHDLLHSTLASWARHTEESRGHAYMGPRSTIGLSTWLATNVTRLAMTEGCEEAHDEIEHAMSQCRRACDLAKDRNILLGICQGCGSQVHVPPGKEHGSCQCCGAWLTLEETRAAIDSGLTEIVLQPKDAVQMVNTRYGCDLKVKVVYDMGNRKKEPLVKVPLGGGQVGFRMGDVVADLKRQGRIA